MKKKFLILLLGMAVVGSLLTGCGNSEPVKEVIITDKPEEETSDELKEDELKEDTLEEDTLKEDDTKENPEFHSISEKNSDFENVSFVIDYISNEEDKNIIYSDMSLNMALGLLANGAEGETKEALEEYFGLDVSSKTERDSELTLAYNGYEEVDVRLANSIYSDIDMPLLDDYINEMNSKYLAEVQVLDFHNDSANTAKTVNDWCSLHTEGKIDSIVNSDIVNNNDVLLVNALYFNGKWSKPFEDHQLKEYDFSNVNGTKTTLTGMEEYGLNFYESDNTTAFSKDYEGNDFAFYGILPNEDICDKNGNFKLEDVGLDEILLGECSQEKEAHIIMPKFKVEDSNKLKDALSDNGLDILFNEGDFRKMCEEDLVVSQIIQKTFVDVNEEGTEAAAVTAVEMKANSIEPVVETVDVVLDRPFVFVIYDKVNNEILFIGKIINLEQ